MSRFSDEYDAEQRRMGYRKYELKELAKYVLADFQAAQLLLQSRNYESLKNLIRYIETGKTP